MTDLLATACEMTPAEIFSRLPPGRVGDLDRRYLNEVLDAGFWNTEDLAAHAGHHPCHLITKPRSKARAIGAKA